MSYPYYSDELIQATEPVELPPSSYHDQKPEHYLPDSGLVNAVNVALILGQPLLLTGEAGTGKTQLAYHLAHQLRLAEPLKFETKSNSIAKDLFYLYDYLGHFYAAQTKQGSQRSQDYITYHALGLAILRANPVDQIQDIINNSFKQISDKPCRSVVLIDEIDKAPRDFPNDILNEVEAMYFRIAELQNREVKAEPALSPVLVLTSNSEKHLPDAFLRRCIYYHIPFPEKERLTKIVVKRLGDDYSGQKSGFLSRALDFFYELRKGNLRKKPATAELLNWLTTFHEIFPDAENNNILSAEILLTTALGCLAKQDDDVAKAKQVIEDWVKNDKISSA